MLVAPGRRLRKRLRMRARSCAFMAATSGTPCSPCGTSSTHIGSQMYLHIQHAPHFGMTYHKKHAPLFPHFSHDAPQRPSRPPCTIVRTHVSSPDPAQERQSMKLVLLSGALRECTSLKLRSTPPDEAMRNAQRPQRQPSEPAQPCSISHLPLTTHVPSSEFHMEPCSSAIAEV